MSRRFSRAAAALCAVALAAGTLLAVAVVPAAAAGTGPTIQVILTNDRIWNQSNDWAGGGDGTATLNIERGGNLAFGPITTPISSGTFQFNLYPGNGGPEFDVQSGDVVTVTDDSSNSATTTVAAFGVTGVDGTTRTISGFGPAGTDVNVTAQTPGQGDCIRNFPDPTGSWSVAFDDCVPNLPFVAGSTFGSAQVADGDGNITFVDWNVPLPPQLFINGRFNGVEGWNFAPNANAHISIYDHLNDANPPLVEQDTPTDGNGNFSYYFNDPNFFDITPGMWVVVTDGNTTKDAVVSELEVWGSNATDGTVYGHAEPGSTVTVKTTNQGQDCSRDVVADGNGDWTVDFGNTAPNSNPPDCTLPVPFVMPTQSPGTQQGVVGDAFQTDGDGDWTGHELWNPSWINVSALADRVEGIGASFRVGANVTVTIDDPSTGPSPDVSVQGTVGAGWPEQFAVCTSPGVQVGQFGCTSVGGPIDIKAGFVITADDGTTPKSTVVTAVAVTSVDAVTSTVSGTAQPGSSVLAVAYDFFQQHSRTAYADQQGHWTADFSVGQGNEGPFQFGPGTTGVALQSELVGPVDGDQTNYFWSSAPYLDVTPDTNLVDGQTVTITGANWPTNKTMYVNECALGQPFSPDACDQSTTQTLTTDGNGNVSGQYHVKRDITTNAYGAFNCADTGNQCGLIGVVWHGQFGNVQQGISLDTPENNPLSFGAYLDVAPSNTLVDGQTVTITGAGWPVNKTMYVSECALGVPLSQDTCDATTTQNLATDGNGRVVAGPYQLERDITTNTTGAFNCADTGKQCGLVGVVWHGTPGNVGEGLTFDPPGNNQLQFAAYLDVAPSTNLKEGQMVTITGAGWPVSKTLFVSECNLGVSLNFGTCDTATEQQLATGADGRVSGQYKVSRSIFTTNPAPGVQDCTAADKCGLLGIVWHGQVGNLGQGFTLDDPTHNKIRFAVTPDATPPTVKVTSPVDGAVIPEHKLVKASFSCTDTGGSGLATCSGDVANGSPINTTTLNGHTFTVRGRDRAGNLAVVFRTYMVTDVTAPLIFLNTPTNGALYEKGAIVNAIYSCSDGDGSGVAICGGSVASGTPIDTTTLGTKTFSVTAVDNFNNTTKVTSSYKIIYPWRGFWLPFQTLPDPPAVNEAGVSALHPAPIPAGQKLPMAFDLGGRQGLPVTSGAKSIQIDCTTKATIGSSSAATISSVIYNYAPEKYTFDWTTKAVWANTCRQFQLTLKDGTVHNVNFHFTP